MNNKHKLKSAIVHGVSLLLFFALAFGTTAASAGLLGGNTVTGSGDLSPGDIGNPFFPTPPQDDSVTTAPPSDPNQPSDPDNSPNSNPQTSYVSNLKNAFNTALIEGFTADRTSVSLSKRVELYNRLTASLGTNTAAVAPASYQLYNADTYTIARRLSLDYEYLTGTETITKYTKQYNNQDSSYITVANPYLVGRKTVQPYMGYLIVSRVVTRNTTEEVTVLSLYDRNGNLLVDDLGSKTPYYARDYSNHPVFIGEDGSLFAFTGTKFTSIQKDDLRSNLFYDYPAIPLGAYEGTYEAHYSFSRGGYNYINYKTGRSMYTASFFKAFNYSADGIAVVISSENNTLQVINHRKKQVFKPGSQYVYYVDPNTGKKQNAKDYYYFPDTYGIESIGAAGYDHGWLRLRIRTASMMNDSWGTTIHDQDYLVDTAGNKFPIPDGYTLEGYSDGILLLSRNGLYGYYSIEGEWIAQPIYTYARPFIQGLAVLGSEDGTVGMIDTKGNIVLPFVYTSISDISSGVIVTYCEGIGWETYEMIKK